jgi:hypothetical protein
LNEFLSALNSSLDLEPLELRKKQELRKVKDLGIGVGLSCSKELS